MHKNVSTTFDPQAFSAHDGRAPGCIGCGGPADNLVTEVVACDRCMPLVQAALSLLRPDLLNPLVPEQSPERRGALRRAREIGKWAAEAAEMLSRVDVPDSQVKPTMEFLNTWWAQTVARLKQRDGVKSEAAFEFVAILLEGIRTPPKNGWQHDAAWIVRSFERRWPEYAGRLDEKGLGRCLTKTRPDWQFLQTLLVGANLRPAQSNAESLRVGFYEWLKDRGCLGLALRKVLHIDP